MNFKVYFKKIGTFAKKKFWQLLLAACQNAEIPEKYWPLNAMDINGIKLKSIVDILKSLGVFKKVSVSGDLVRAEFHTKLLRVGISITADEPHNIKATAYVHTYRLPAERAEELGNDIFSVFSNKGTAKCTPTELSYTLKSDAKEGEKGLESLVRYMLSCILKRLSDVEQVANEEYNRCRKEMEREKKERERRQREYGLNHVFDIPLSACTTVAEVQRLFSEQFPKLELYFFLVQTANRANKTGESIAPINNDLTLKQIRSFRGDAIISIAGKNSPKDVEYAFRNRSGLVVKVCYGEYYISPESKYYTMALYDINKLDLI